MIVRLLQCGHGTGSRAAIMVVDPFCNFKLPGGERTLTREECHVPDYVIACKHMSMGMANRSSPC